MGGEVEETGFAVGQHGEEDVTGDGEGLDLFPIVVVERGEGCNELEFKEGQKKDEGHVLPGMPRHAHRMKLARLDVRFMGLVVLQGQKYHGGPKSHIRARKNRHRPALPPFK